MKTKVCTNCGTEREIEEFQPNARYKDRFSTWCRDCHKEASKESHRKAAKENPDYHKNNALLYKHHWTPEQYSAKLEEQGRHCALCPATTSQGERLSVDHDHEICPGKYACDKCRRGLLCSACNARLGYLEQTLRDALVFPFLAAANSWTSRALQYLKGYQK